MCSFIIQIVNNVPIDLQQQYIMLSQKQLAEARQQMRRQVADLDHQIHELETFYLEDTKEVGNLFKGFQTYVPNKTSKIQSGSKKPRAENYERLFSLSSITSNTSKALEESLMADPISKADLNRDSKRQRFRGKPKSGGKTVMKQEGEEDDELQSGQAEDDDDSGDDSVSKNKGASKKKKHIHKMPQRKG